MEKESISRKSKLFGQLNKITLLSKVLAGTLFVTLPVLLFWVGFNQGYSQGLASGGYIQQSEDLVISQTTNPTDTVSPSTTLTPTPLLILNPLTDKYYFLETISENGTNPYENIYSTKITEVNPDGTTKIIFSKSNSSMSYKASMLDANTIGLYDMSKDTIETIDINNSEEKVLKKFNLEDNINLNFFSWIDKESFVYTINKYIERSNPDLYSTMEIRLMMYKNGVEKEIKLLNESMAPQRGLYYETDSLRFMLSPNKKMILLTIPNKSMSYYDKTYVFDLFGVEKLSLENASSVEWVDDSFLVYTSTEDGNLYKINIVTKVKELLLNTSNNPVYGIRHRNSRLIYWRPSENENAVIYLFDLKSKTEKRLTGYATEAEWLNDNEIYFSKVKPYPGYTGFEHVSVEWLNVDSLKRGEIFNRVGGLQLFSQLSKNIDYIICDNSTFCLD